MSAEEFDRRRFFSVASALAAVRGTVSTPLAIPVRRIVDRRANWTPDQLRNFWRSIWPEAARTFGQCDIQLQTTDVPGEIKLSPAGKPIFDGAARGTVNLILTGYLPMEWDQGRQLAGATMVHEGYHLCVLALRYAHINRIPYFSVNTCVHELLHALLQDVFVSKPKWYQSGEREFRDDFFATNMWLFHNGSGVREAAWKYLKRLESNTRP